MGANMWPPKAPRRTAPHVSLVAAIDASFGRAIQLLDSIASADGALRAADKDVLAVAMTALADPDGCLLATERAVGSGSARPELHAVALALYLSRGERPAGVVLDAVDRALPIDHPSVTRGLDPAAVSTEEIVAEFTAVFGELPARVRLLQEHAPEGLEAYHRMRVAVLREGALTPRLAELVLFAVNAIEHRAEFAAVHARGARRAGAGEAELVEAGLCTIRHGGVAAWLAASEAIEATADATDAGRADDGNR